MEGNDWSCVVEGDSLSGSVSLPSVESSTPHGRFPSADSGIGSGAGLDLIMAFSTACSAGERKIVAPSLRSGRWGCELGISAAAFPGLGVGVAVGAIVGVMQQNQNRLYIIISDSKF